ncbi:ASCH domain-containing protein [Ornithinimicrobium cryptoxanthini]|uniref:ASCH domain-containing protein n=1 Tax=Ornithinimicrobium cryptoxanthini TaxID=2934161 RepID=A0ABY4YLL2_9MICO|nr:ASCH domain-containing protein [Ornithinimicrobium cryptoxanthini]USQ77666.1 ASCH domain-containing protein [Ornithinimicrobium cryptoxanthini]
MSDEIQSFWDDARLRAKVNRVPGYLGVNARETLAPPVWSFGASPEEADELLALVLAGTKTATSSALRDYSDGDDVVPTDGDLSIITDGAGHPRALVQTTQVRTVPFAEVGAAHAEAEGEGDLSLEHWREVHRAFFEKSGGGAPVTDDMPVVLEEFIVLHAADTADS